jgi:hypothetical protein
MEPPEGDETFLAYRPDTPVEDWLTVHFTKS